MLLYLFSSSFMLLMFIHIICLFYPAHLLFVIVVVVLKKNISCVTVYSNGLIAILSYHIYFCLWYIHFYFYLNCFAYKLATVFVFYISLWIDKLVILWHFLCSSNLATPWRRNLRQSVNVNFGEAKQSTKSGQHVIQNAKQDI